MVSSFFLFIAFCIDLQSAGSRCKEVNQTETSGEGGGGGGGGGGSFVAMVSL